MQIVDNWKTIFAALFHSITSIAVRAPFPYKFMSGIKQLDLSLMPSAASYPNLRSAVRGMPGYATALISALSFRYPRPELLHALDDSDWQRLLDFGDQMHLTIPLAQACGNHFPSWVRARVDRNIADNALRFQMIKITYSEIADALSKANVDHLVLKGFTKTPDYAPDPRHRIQSDIDLFCPSESIFAARDALSAVGFRAQHGFDDMPWDHLPPLRRKTTWKWRGNAYDPEMPLTIELHHSLWDRAAARCGPLSLNCFWQRRIARRLEEISFHTLSSSDSLGYAALNLLRDLLRLSIVTSHVYELAWFLHHNSRNEDFWTGWSHTHDDELRRLESVSFLLAKTWFHCDLPEAAEAQIERLPAATRRWFETPATSPSPMGWLRPSKDGVWLHSSLLESDAEKRKLLFQRLLPIRALPVGAAIANRVPNSSPAEDSSLYNYTRYLAYFFARATYHLRVLPITLWHGLCWWWTARS